MIALDSQPFSVIEDTGFIQLLHVLETRYNIPSRNYLVSNILPQVHAGIRSQVKNAISEGLFISFTTDAWSSDGATGSLLSLTAHAWAYREIRQTVCCLASSTIRRILHWRISC